MKRFYLIFAWLSVVCTSTASATGPLGNYTNCDAITLSTLFTFAPLGIPGVCNPQCTSDLMHGGLISPGAVGTQCIFADLSSSVGGIGNNLVLDIKVATPLEYCIFHAPDAAVRIRNLPVVQWGGLLIGFVSIQWAGLLGQPSAPPAYIDLMPLHIVGGTYDPPAVFNRNPFIHEAVRTVDYQDYGILGSGIALASVMPAGVYMLTMNSRTSAFGRHIPEVQEDHQVLFRVTDGDRKILTFIVFPQLEIGGQKFPCPVYTPNIVYDPTTPPTLPPTTALVQPGRAASGPRAEIRRGKTKDSASKKKRRKLRGKRSS